MGSELVSVVTKESFGLFCSHNFETLLMVETDIDAEFVKKDLPRLTGSGCLRYVRDLDLSHNHLADCYP